MSTIISSLGGYCPVQGEGEIDGVPFYFRARHDGWDMSIGNDPVGISVRGGGWSKGGDFDNASWMPHEDARRIVEECAEEYRAENGRARNGRTRAD